MIERLLLAKNVVQVATHFTIISIPAMLGSGMEGGMVRKARVATLSLIATLLLSACADPGITITKNEFGKEWPFTVDAGKLECLKGQAVIFRVNGKAYAVNGYAKAYGYASIDPIWREDPEMKKALAGTGSVIPKVNISPVINKGLSLCNQ